MTLNSVPIELWPEVVYGDIETPALAEMGQYLTALAGAGKLPEEDFGTIWRTSPVFESFRQLEIKSCESCHRFDMCHGGCPAIAYHTQRKLGLPDPGCLANCVTMKTVLKEAI